MLRSNIDIGSKLQESMIINRLEEILPVFLCSHILSMCDSPQRAVIPT